MKRFAAGLACVTLAALFYVYEEIEAVKVGYEIQKKEDAKTQALDRGRALKYNIARLEAPHNLERKLLAQRIQLESPKSWQTLVLPDGPGKSTPARLEPGRPPFFVRLLVGTAQAEAKESSR